jgi:hypothetical protein
MILAMLAFLTVLGQGVIRRAQVTGRPPGRDGVPVTAMNAETLATALAQLRADCGRAPSAGEGLAALVRDPGLSGWRGPYVVALKPDAWGRDFGYAPSSNGFRVFSSGPDGLAGTGDDVAAVRAERGAVEEYSEGVYPASLRPAPAR